MGEEREAEWSEQEESDKRGQPGENKGELDEGNNIKRRYVIHTVVLYFRCL